MPLDKALNKELFHFLDTQLTAVIATSAPDGRPEAATIYYWANDVGHEPDGFNVYLVTRRSSRKFEHILINPYVSLVIGTGMAPVTVQIDGEAEVLEAADGILNLKTLERLSQNKFNLLRLYYGALFPQNPFGGIFGDDFAVIRVKPTWVRWMRHHAAKNAIDYVRVK